jgi:metal-dependent HD superfamily phosphatase/phosphodiesterase
MQFNIPAKDNKKLAKIVKHIEKNARIEQVLRCVNVTAVDRLGFSDHGPVHSKIVSNIALKILRILLNRSVVPSIVKNYKDEKMDKHDAEIVVVLGAFFHDIGMVIHREHHDIYGIAIAQPILEGLLKFYTPRKRAIMIAEIMHAMAFHDSKTPPLTIEGGIVRISDGLDMTHGRARIPFEAGEKGIHAVSAVAIESVEIKEGSNNEKPVQIIISMSNSAGIFQVDELLKKKIAISKLAEHIHVTAKISGKEKSILEKIEF